MESTKEMKEYLISILKLHCPPLVINSETDTNFEVRGNSPTMQGKKKVDGMYFASIIEKPKDVRLYFFPIYTDLDKFTNIPDILKKCLKGKSCFHFKKIGKELEIAIKEMIEKGIEIYTEKKLLI